VKALRRVAIAGAAAALALLAACSGAAERPPAAPPRATDRIALPQEPSEIAVDLKVDLADLGRALEREIPRRLWAIDRPGSECVAPKKVDLALFEVRSPRIKCRIVGEVTRGRLRLGGSGRTIRVTMPIRGTLAARDVAGIFKGETGTGAAEVALSLRFDVDRNWGIKGDTRIDYSWSREPGIDFLGRRITFTTEADRELAPVKRDIERILSRELARLPLRAMAQQGWTEAHQVLSINRENPAVWGRLTPRQFRYGGYEVAGGTLTLRLGLDAALETFVGIAPDRIAPGPLPPLAPRDKTIRSSVLHVPVVADYAVLEPVIAKALAKRAQRPFQIKDYGSVRASFENITVYGTAGGRIAVGGRFAATSDLPLIKAASGTIWLTARPGNAPGSRAVRFTEVTIAGETDIVGQDFLFALANSPEFQGAITDALAQNFENDFAKLRAKIDRALTKPGGRLTETRITLENVQTGVISAHGEGLYLPVDLTVRITSRLRSLN
jgi:hypothetical protein